MAGMVSRVHHEAFWRITTHTRLVV